MKKIYTKIALFLTGAIPLGVHADAAVDGINNLGNLVETFNKSIVSALIALFASAALAAFFFGIVKFIFGIRNGVEKDITAGKQFIGWGLLALFVMFSVFGIVTWGQRIFGIEGKTDIAIPQIKGAGNVTPNNTTSNSNSGLPVSRTRSTCPDGVTTYTSLENKDQVCGTSGSSQNSGSGSNTNSCPNGAYDSFGTCCDLRYNYIDTYGGCKSSGEAGF